MWCFNNQIKNCWISFLHISCHKENTTLACENLPQFCTVALGSQSVFWFLPEWPIVTEPGQMGAFISWALRAPFICFGASTSNLWCRCSTWEIQVLFYWLNSKDTAGNLYVMMCFWSPITAKAAKILGLMRGLFLFRNLSTKPACLCSEYRPVFLYACSLPLPAFSFRLLLC